MKKVVKKAGRNKSRIGTAVAVGVAAIAAGATTYALTGPNGKKNRAKVANAYKNIKKKVTENKNVKLVTANIKNAVTNVKREAGSVTKKASSAVKKASSGAKKVVKKTASKVSSTAKKAVKKAKSAVKKSTQ